MFDIAFKWLNEGNQTKRKTLIIIQHVFGAQIFLVLIHSCYCVTTLKWLMMPLFIFFQNIHNNLWRKHIGWSQSPQQQVEPMYCFLLLHLPYCWVILRAHKIESARDRERERGRGKNRVREKNEKKSDHKKTHIISIARQEFKCTYLFHYVIRQSLYVHKYSHIFRNSTAQILVHMHYFKLECAFWNVYITKRIHIN